MARARFAGVDLDLAYFDWSFASWGNLIGGKMKQPFYKLSQSAFWDNDIDRPYVERALYDGRGEGGIPATPGGKPGSTDTSVFAKSSDHNPSAQGNLTGGHSPAWHGAAAGDAAHRHGVVGRPLRHVHQ